MPNTKHGFGLVYCLLFSLLAGWCPEVLAQNCTGCNQPLVNGRCVTPGCPNNKDDTTITFDHSHSEADVSFAITDAGGSVGGVDVITSIADDNDEDIPKPKPPHELKHQEHQEQQESTHSSELTLDQILVLIPITIRHKLRKQFKEMSQEEAVTAILDLTDHPETAGLTSREYLVQLAQAIKQLQELLKKLYLQFRATQLIDEMFLYNTLSQQINEIHASLKDFAWAANTANQIRSFNNFIQEYGATHNLLARVGDLDTPDADVVTGIHQELQRNQQVVVAISLTLSRCLMLMLTPVVEPSTGVVTDVKVSAPDIATVMMDIAHIQPLLNDIMAAQQLSDDVSRGIFAVTRLRASQEPPSDSSGGASNM